MPGRTLESPKFLKAGGAPKKENRNHPWQLASGGLYIPHDYTEKTNADLSWWDDVGFILNKRRVIVWWQHPRHLYSEEIGRRARTLAGDDPSDGWLFEGGTKNYKRAGRSRKKLVSYTSRKPSEAQQRYYNSCREIEQRMTVDGIEFEVGTSWSRERLSWATGVELIVPLEVRNETELAVVAQLARRLLLGQTTLQAEFPGYRYTREHWLAETDGPRGVGAQSHALVHQSTPLLTAVTPTRSPG